MTKSSIRGVLGEKVKNHVASFFEITTKELESESRKRNLIDARMICYKLLKDIGCDDVEIGILFNRDRASVWAALKTFAALYETYELFAFDFNTCESALTGLLSQIKINNDGNKKENA
jgi:chromosomal replication initiation ATPase DnaA